MTCEVIVLPPSTLYRRGMASAARAPHVGRLLREWRLRRHVSQLRLAARAAVSARHLSFIETGRARPSREMVLHLADRLDVPLRERNRLLLAAGFAPAYGEHELDSEELAAVRGALERFLAAHEPYPAIVVDGGWNLVLANAAVTLLAEGVGPELMEPPANVLRATLHPDGMAPRILNFDDWCAHLVHRLRRHVEVSGDARLEALLQEVLSYPGVRDLSPGREAAAAAGIVLPLQLRHGSGRLSLFGTVSTFGTPADVTLSELSVEAFYPADAETAAALAAASAERS
jgi:transcriptional regulator with XRE-family HTH domain